MSNPEDESQDPSAPTPQPASKAGAQPTRVTGDDGGATPMSSPHGQERAGQWIGPYRLLQALGEGGFGSVWMAEQREPVKRRVALKLIKLGMDTREVIARFEAERQALALMDHPNIARVFDAGATEAGRPYFVMELVKGAPINEFCDDQRLDLVQRLQLFSAVCRAIHHAHQKGVIHRDIKPSNILVTLNDGHPSPKVIDFGVAKATGAELAQHTLFTELNQVIGTPAYMSPEQAQMTGLDIDTRSDVYSLGVLLYELVTGTTPHDSVALRNRGYAEMLRIIREEDPPRPSTRLSQLGTAGPRTSQLRRVEPRRLQSTVRGDLDWIVMRCLEKDRVRRYDSSSALADDIERHLRHEPVLAGPPSARYRVAKFVRRNRGQVAAAALVLVALLVGLAGTVHGWNRALSAQNRAELAEVEVRQQAEELRSVVDFQRSQLSDLSAALMGARIRERVLEEHRGGADADVASTVLADELRHINFTNVALDALDQAIFERASGAIERDFAERPLLQARLLHTLAETAHAVGLLDRAETSIDTALGLRREQLGPRHPETQASLLMQSNIEAVRGRYTEAEALARELLASYSDPGLKDEPMRLSALHQLGWTLRMQGRHAESEAATSEALEGRRRVLGSTHPYTLASLDNLGVVLMDTGRYAEAEPLLVESLAGRQATLGASSLYTLYSQNNLGWARWNMRQFEASENLLREGRELARQALGDDHPQTLLLSQNLAQTQRSQGRLQEGYGLLRQVLEGRRRTLGPSHPATIATLNQLSIAANEMGDPAMSQALSREALQRGREALGREHPQSQAALNNLGFLAARAGRLDEAIGYQREALEIAVVAHGEDDPRTFTLRHNLGSLLRQMGQLDAAAAEYETLLASARANLAEDNANLLWYEHAYAQVLREQGALEEAAALETAVLGRAADAHAPGAWQPGIFRAQHARTLARMARYDEALELARQGELEVRAIFGAGKGRHTDAVDSLIEVLELARAGLKSSALAEEAEAWRQRKASGNWADLGAGASRG